ncbi:MAG TPA: isoprenylcysteine carboxylmethyltransferase family protein [Anaerolineae bacterium]|nr:isoprenylcysteine carboxylmethyltransferase family protein [Anaerolineae bacterium]
MSEHKDHADVKIHPPVLTFIFIFLAYLTNWLIPLQFSMQWLRYLGFAIAIIGFLLPFFAIREFMKAKTTVNPHGSVSNIISSGIFRLSRNPIYVGFVLMLIGFPLYSGTYWGLILSPVLIICFNKLVIEHEEAYLEKKFGEQYTNYKSRVRRWL